MIFIGNYLNGIFIWSWKFHCAIIRKCLQRISYKSKFNCTYLKREKKAFWIWLKKIIKVNIITCSLLCLDLSLPQISRRDYKPKGSQIFLNISVLSRFWFRFKFILLTSFNKSLWKGSKNEKYLFIRKAKNRLTLQGSNCYKLM